MKAFKMLMMDGKVPLNSVIMNNIELLKSYINNNHLGDLTINIHPNKTKGVLTFTPANESIQLSGFNMYINSLVNEMQMDNGTTYLVGNETSSYELEEFRNILNNTFPEILPMIDSNFGFQEGSESNINMNLLDVLLPKTDNKLSSLPNDTPKISNEDIFDLLQSMKSMLDRMQVTLTNLADTQNKKIETNIPEETNQEDVEMPGYHRDETINVTKAEAATEVSTPQEVTVPDNELAREVVAKKETNQVETLETSPNPNINTFKDETKDSTPSTLGLESEEYVGELGEIQKFVLSLKSKIPGLESNNISEAENILNNYIISNVDKGNISPVIIRLFNEYSFMESIETGVLSPLDRVTQVRRQLSTNNFI